MSDPHGPLFAELKNELARAKSEIGEMARLRWRLAQLELNQSVGQIKRLAIVLAVVGITALTALPVLVVWAAETLALRAGLLPAHGWMLLLALAMLAAAGLGGLLTWRRFRREFTGLEQSLDELREDLVWLREWTARDKDTEGG